MRTTCEQSDDATLALTGSYGEGPSIRRPSAAQRSSFDLKQHESRNPRPLFPIPHISIAVLRARQNTIEIRIPVEGSDRQVMLQTHNVKTDTPLSV